MNQMSDPGPQGPLVIVEKSQFLQQFNIFNITLHLTSTQLASYSKEVVHELEFRDIAVMQI